MMLQFLAQPMSDAIYCHSWPCFDQELRPPSEVSSSVNSAIPQCPCGLGSLLIRCCGLQISVSLVISRTLRSVVQKPV